MAGSYGRGMSDVTETVRMFSKVIVQLYILSAVHEISCPSTSLPRLGIVRFFYLSSSTGLVSLVCISLVTTDMENVFMPLFAIHIFFLNKMSIQIFCSFFKLRCLPFIWSGGGR